MQRGRSDPLNRTRQRVVAALQQSGGLNKYELAAVVHVSPVNTRRYLSCLHLDGLVHICGWCKIGIHHSAVWAYGPGEDVPKPAAATLSEYGRRWRSKENVAAAQAARKRAKRKMDKVRRAPSLIAALLGVQ